MTSSSERIAVLEKVHAELMRKTELLTKQIAEVRESLLNDSKSSAGDKHETSRAMVQLELEKLGKQLQESERNIAVFKRIRELPPKPTIQSGSLIKTENYFIFIGVGIGIIHNDGRRILAISVNVPLSNLLIGKRQGETIIWNGEQIIIDQIL